MLEENSRLIDGLNDQVRTIIDNGCSCEFCREEITGRHYPFAKDAINQFHQQSLAVYNGVMALLTRQF